MVQFSPKEKDLSKKLKSSSQKAHYSRGGVLCLCKYNFIKGICVKLYTDTQKTRYRVLRAKKEQKVIRKPFVVNNTPIKFIRLISVYKPKEMIREDHKYILP